MGQVALGFRSLLVKLTIFVIMAALLAWALGGTLWPRAEIVDLPPVPVGEHAYHWRLEVGGGTVGERRDGEKRWRLMVSAAAAPPVPAQPGVEWYDVAPLVPRNDGLWLAGQPAAEGPWRLERIERPDAPPAANASIEYPDRLTVDLQLARLRAGLAPESPEEADARRPSRLDPPPAALPADP